MDYDLKLLSLKEELLNELPPTHPVAAGILLESVEHCGGATRRRQRTLKHLTGDGVVLNLSLARRGYSEQVPDIRALPSASVDLLLSDSTYLRRASSAAPPRRTGDRNALLAGCTPHTLRTQGMGISTQARLRWNVFEILDQFSRISTPEGLCLLGYQHVLASAWLALGEALAASEWRCVRVVPWPARVPSDPYLRSRVLLWDALLVCRKVCRRRSPGICAADAPVSGSQPLLCACYGVQTDSLCGNEGDESGELVVVKSTALGYAAKQVAEYARMLDKPGRERARRRERMRRADRQNLWGALVISQAHLGNSLMARSFSLMPCSLTETAFNFRIEIRL